jgi:hypothetical protein
MRNRSSVFEFAFLQHAEKLHLNVRRQVDNLVEKDRAAIGELEAFLTQATAPVNAPFSWAEELAFDQRGGNRGAVDPHQRPRMPAAPFGQRTREQFLAASSAHAVCVRDFP